MKHVDIRWRDEDFEVVQDVDGQEESLVFEPKQTMMESQQHVSLNRVQVCVRCRPSKVVSISSEVVGDVVQVKSNLRGGQKRSFRFDHVFDTKSTQAQVYDRVAHDLINDILKGINGTIIAYGQTGTGKTHTMGLLFHSQQETGIIPRAFAQIFEQLHGRDQHATVRMSFLQIYLDTLQDLLAPQGTSLKNLALREDPEHGVYVEGLRSYQIASYAEAYELIRSGTKNRSVASTEHNRSSSRSHTVLSVQVQVEKGKIGKLLLVDLAGSERLGAGKYASSNNRTEEAKSINKSLYALGSVIAALSKRQHAHIRYRDSKLTRILQGTIGGAFNTSFIATIDPSVKNTMETISTLQFAHRCKQIECIPTIQPKHTNEVIENNMQKVIQRMHQEFVEKQVQLQATYENRISQLQKSFDLSMLSNQDEIALKTTYEALCDISDCLDGVHNRRHPSVQAFPNRNVLLAYIEGLKTTSLETFEKFRYLKTDTFVDTS